VAIAKKIGIAAVVIFCLTLALSSMANWMLWVLVALVIIMAGWYIYKSRDSGLDRAVEPLVKKVKAKLNGAEMDNA
jgi:hypothetical protein